jgi:hypothetical protein
MSRIKTQRIKNTELKTERNENNTRSATVPSHGYITQQTTTCTCNIGIILISILPFFLFEKVLKYERNNVY